MSNKEESTVECRITRDMAESAVRKQWPELAIKLAVKDQLGTVNCGYCCLWARGFTEVWTFDEGLKQAMTQADVKGIANYIEGTLVLIHGCRSIYFEPAFPELFEELAQEASEGRGSQNDESQMSKE